MVTVAFCLFNDSEPIHAQGPTVCYGWFNRGARPTTPGLLRPPSVEGMREAEPLPLPELSPDNYYHHVIGQGLALPELSNQDY